MFFLDESNTVIEWNEPEEAQQGHNDSINYTAENSSKLAMYWPNLFYQGNDNALYQYNYSSDNSWHRGSIGPAPSILAVPGSGLGTLPKNQNYTVLSLFYQRGDGELAEYWYTTTNNSWGPGMPPFP
jgi:hypothetical protein